MKTILLSLLLTCGSFLYGQFNNDAPYKKLGVLPPLNLLHLDSSRVTTLNQLPTDMPVLVICYSTTCDHCQQEARDLVKNSEKFRKIRIVFVTPENLVKIRHFHDTYQLNQLPNLVIGKDFRFFAPGFFTFKKFPFSVLYDRNHKYLASFEGTTTVEQLLEEFRKKGAL